MSELMVKGKNEQDAQGTAQAKAVEPILNKQMVLRRKTAVDFDNITPAQISHLQRTIGNQAVRRLVIQRKMTLGPVGDKYEQEADAVAAQVVGKLNSPQSEVAQRQEEEEELQMMPISHLQRQEEEEEELQMKPASDLQRQEEEEELQMMPSSMMGSGDISSDIEGQIQGAKGGGRPLTSNVQASMGQAFNADFSGVNIHTNGQSDTLNRSLQARAFTTGQDIFFRSGEYNPDSGDGQALLAHELTHTIQQGAAPVQKQADESPAQVKPNREQDVLSRKGAYQPGQGLVQRSPLDNGKLNLVGESHFNNPERRAAEKGYGINEGGGSYWREKSFKYGTNDKRGDPDNLIIGYRIDRFKRHIDDLTGGHNPRELTGMQKYCQRISNDLNNADKFPHQGQQAPMLASLVKLRKWTVGLIISWNGGLHANPNGWQALINQKMLFIKPEYEQLNKAYEAITKRNSERDAIDARYARSDAMWIGAALGGKTGLWKVGQNHVDDINLLHGEYDTEGTYKNLRDKFADEVKMQSKADFEAEFQIWWTANEVTYPR